ncbi:MAG: DUF971 domain-containing protein [Candidatus Kapabacteria bacterium]|jgi:DUF971 family protein|nr:DUF971 domain-containing protein [Candidatus Kapabacteria bacterium]
MPNILPIKIERPNQYMLKTTWTTNEEFVILLSVLRENCPCAQCQGETIMGTHYAFPMLQIAKPGQNSLKQIVPVGNYALQFFWEDEHTTGIYTWEYLYSLCTSYSLRSDEIEKLLESERQKS